MRFPEDIVIANKLLDEVAEHAITSRSQLAKRTRHNDEKIGRLIEEMDMHFGSVLAFEAHRLTITSVGREVRRQFGQLIALSEKRETPEDSITVEADAWLCESLLPRVLRQFLPLWGSVQLRIRPLSDSRRNVAEGTTTFAISVAGSDEAIAAKESLPKVPWVLVRSAEFDGQAAVEQGSKIFLPPSLAAHPSIEAFLRQHPSVVPCEACMAMAAAGGVALVPDVLGPIEGVTKTEVRGAAPVQLRLILPRQAAAISEPVHALLDILRQAIERKATPEPAMTELPAAAPAAGNGHVATLEVSEEQEARS